LLIIKKTYFNEKDLKWILKEIEIYLIKQ